MLGLLASVFAVACEGRINGSATGVSPTSNAGTGAGGDSGPGAGGSGSMAPNCAVASGQAALPARLRRLTQAEYVNTLRSLVGDGVTLPPIEFPPDATLGTFHDAASLLRVTDLLASGLEQAAQRLAHSASQQLPALLGCDPAQSDEQACVTQFLTSFGARAYRRPLGMSELQRLLDVYAQGRAGADARSGVALALELIFQSPNLIYRSELGPRDSATAETDLTLHELASELSYLVTSGPPDAELTRAAVAGQLSDASAREAHARRLLSEPAARETMATFATEWLDIGDLPKVSKDPALFPGFSPESARVMQRATVERFSGVVFDGDGKLRSLLLGQLLTEPSLLAAHSGPQWSSPTHRGKLIRNQFLCQQVPPAPAGLIVTVPPEVPGVTTRQRMLTHASDPSCRGCHAQMDPLGFAFEHYDAVGAYRAQDNGLTIDTTGEVSGGTDADGAFDGAEALAQRLAESRDARVCLARQWTTFALGAEVTSQVACALAEPFNEFGAERLSLRELLIQLVRSDTFVKRRVTGP